jgi:1-deoxy-D-xylulose-5-phosphate synthase
VFALDRAGLVGGDGATHQGSFDLVPALHPEHGGDGALRRGRDAQAPLDGLPAPRTRRGRYPRGTGPGATIDPALEAVAIGKGVLRRAGREVAILGFGSMVAAALAAASALEASVADMRFVKPLDEELILELCASHSLLVTVEENAVAGGAGARWPSCWPRAAS